MASSGHSLSQGSWALDVAVPTGMTFGYGMEWVFQRLQFGWKMAVVSYKFPQVDSGHSPGLSIPPRAAWNTPHTHPRELHPWLTHLLPPPSLVRQYADICLFNTAQYKCPVAMEEAE